MANAKYDPELKKEVIDAIVNGGRSSAQAARDYELPVTVVYTWVRAHKLKNDLAVIPNQSESLEQENKRLKKELAQAKMERDILKKATAYFASLDK
ncbi:transposase [Thiosulfativibrio zosterae]|uniref:Transposase n=1 Tax=Thiosulfativibrio zosterae TaxID=2675053 RepID=A0A6F8PLY4_9GAMM|nr:transposase [Thiosulfativibrio zosterae]BBP43044.1 transposase [Thiosulfativibrio zosterae]BBP43078.1 transposase [Thiosulfativibrio zosterae]